MKTKDLEQENNQPQQENKEPVDQKKTQFQWPFYYGDTEVGKKIIEFTEGIPYSIFIIIVTIVTLFSDDIRQIFFTSQADIYFSVITIICMTIFMIELVILSIFKEGYFLHFYFWLDLISNLTMILDLMWISELMSGGSGIDAASSVGKVARASRASKIGAKSTKVIRMIRLIRIIKLYKTASNRLEKQHLKKMNTQNSKIKQKQLPQYHNNSALQNSKQKKKISKRMERIRQASCSIIKSERAQKETPNESTRTISNRHIEVRARRNSSKRSQQLPSIAENQQSSNLELQKKFHPLSLRKISTKNALSLKCVLQKKQENVNPVKIISQEQVDNHEQQQLQKNDQQTYQNYEIPNETKVGSKLKQEIQKNVVSMILLLLIAIPLFTVSTWYNHDTAYDTALYQLIYSTNNTNLFDKQAKNYIVSMLAAPQPLVFFEVPINTTCCIFPTDYPDYQNQVRDIYSLRSTSLNAVVDDSSGSTFIFDKTDSDILASELNLGRTLFVCLLLMISTLLFSNDVQHFALQPLENMINTVKRISANPIQAICQIESQKLYKAEVEKQQHNTYKTQPMILEQMIIKISSLLLIGFGEAGTEIIARNIQNHGTLNVMIPGRKVMAIFGFCDIRNFTDATEVLQAQVMVFVNEIASICHQLVYKNLGSPNKNIGDAFLLVWKFDQEDTLLKQKGSCVDLQISKNIKVSQTADLAVYSLIKMIADITKSYPLQKYKNNPGLQNRIPNYQGVKMGFGLHIGWAIEGPIGSEFKIDASYLGSNVNMASRLQGATKKYGVPMLITQQVQQLMTEKSKNFLRNIDNVIIKGTQTPFGLYTVDLQPKNLLKMFGVNSDNELTALQKQKNKVAYNKMRQNLKELIEKKRVKPNRFQEDKDISCMRQPFSQIFFGEFKRGIKYFIDGKWNEAKEKLENAHALSPNQFDGPSAHLINFMQEHEFQSPDDWKGYHEFSE